jgi:hypothetical protein
MKKNKINKVWLSVRNHVQKIGSENRFRKTAFLCGPLAENNKGSAIFNNWYS